MGRLFVTSLATSLLAVSTTPAYAQTIWSEVDARSLIGFGAHIVIQGDEIFVARTGETPLLPLNPSRAGGVHVFSKNADGEWEERAQIQGNDVAIGDKFGEVFVVVGNMLAVGAPAVDDGCGAVYVFERGTSGEWEQTAKIQPDDVVPGDSLGQGIVAGGGTIAVGAPRHAGSGAVFVLRAEDGAWVVSAKLEGSGTEEGKRFGKAIAFGETGLLVGAPGAAGTGAVYVFGWETGEFMETARLLPDSGITAVGFGVRVVMGNGLAVVGAPNSGQGSVGAAYIFEYDPSANEWSGAVPIGPPAATPQALFGTSIAILGNDVLVSSPGADGFQGAVYHFAGTATGWEVANTLRVDGLKQLDMFGWGIAASGDQLAVGAVGMDFFEGKTFSFVRDPDGGWHLDGEMIDRGAGLTAITGDDVKCVDGEASMFNCDEVDLVSFLPVSDVGGGRGIMVSDVWGWTDPETGHEIAIVGRFDGTSFIDIADPANPVYLGNLPLTEGATPSLWRDMKVYQDHVFIVADAAGSHGMQVFDLTQLRNVQDAPATFTETAHYSDMHSAHNIVINEETGFAYTVGTSGGGETCGGALHMIDIRDPANPTFAGCYADPTTGRQRTGYTHDAQCVVYKGPDSTYAGREICFNASETALGIADVTDKENPVAISSATYPNVAYSHQGWLSEDHRFFFLNDELDELSGVPKTRTLVWDVVDLDDPVLLKEHFGETSSTDHNLYVRGNLMYQSNYVSGLRILDVSDPENPREVAFFDTVPFGENTPGFAGSWSNYPYFESGVIVVSSMREGVFFLKKREQTLVP